MKKNLRLMATAALMVVVALLTSCGASGKKNMEQEPKPAVSPDLAYYGLQGPVKRCANVEFNRAGKITKVGHYNPFALTAPYRDVDEEGNFTEYVQWVRDAQGRLCEIDGIEMQVIFTWKDGRVVSEEGAEEGFEWHTDYVYDDEGHLIKTVEYMLEAIDDEESFEDVIPSTQNYTYLEFDSYGNWIRRQVKYVDAMTGDVEEYEEVNEIEYYE